MNHWLAQRSPRDQLSLLVLAGVVLFYLVYVLAWRPLAQARAEIAQRNASAVQTLQRVEGLAAQLRQAQAGGAAPAATGNLTAVLNRSTAAVGLSVSRMQPNSRGEVQLRLEGAPLDRLLRWLHALEDEQGVLVLEAALSEAGGGRVNATLRLGGRS
jgi:type II secretory pathway component PulM